MLGIRKMYRVSNKEVLQRFQRINLSNLMYKCQLRLLGHWTRKDNIRRFALYTNLWKKSTRQTKAELQQAHSKYHQLNDRTATK